MHEKNNSFQKNVGNFSLTMIFDNKFYAIFYFKGFCTNNKWNTIGKNQTEKK